MKQGFLSLMNYEAPLILSNQEPIQDKIEAIARMPLPRVTNTPGDDSEGCTDEVSYNVVGAPAEVEVPNCFYAGVDEATIPEEMYLCQVLGEPVIINTTSDADEVLSHLILPIQHGHTMQSIQ